MIIPINISLDDWANSLIIDFPNDNVPVFSRGDDWKKWGDVVRQEPTFVENACPGTSVYSDWQDWANAVYLAMADEN